MGETPPRAAPSCRSDSYHPAPRKPQHRWGRGFSTLAARAPFKRAGELPGASLKTLAVALGREEQASELFRCLFETVFWRINLGYFDRVPVEGRPQNHIGIVLWCLSVLSPEWVAREDLMRSCTVWDPALDHGPADFAGYAFESRMLRPLTWFGLFETQLVGDASSPSWRRDRQYRKTPLFDQAIRFRVDHAKPVGLAH